MSRRMTPDEKAERRRLRRERNGWPTYTREERPAEYRKLYATRNRDMVASWSLRKRYGITLAERNLILESQGGVCALCFRVAKRWHTDHDHKTGRVRGILCSGCNTALGAFRDDPERLLRAARYVGR